MSDVERTRMHELLDRAERRIAHLEREARRICSLFITTAAAAAAIFVPS